MNCLRIITTNAPGVGDHHGKLISKAALYQLCSCNRNGLLSLIMLNYDLYVHNVIHNAKLWPFVIHNSTALKGHNFCIMNDIANDRKGHNIVNDIEHLCSLARQLTCFL